MNLAMVQLVQVMVPFPHLFNQTLNHLKQLHGFVLPSIPLKVILPVEIRLWPPVAYELG